MPPSARSERVKPCLLDRITDDDGGDQRAYRAFSPQRYKKAVMRDLRWLFNTGAHPPNLPLTDRKPWSARKPGASSVVEDDEEDAPHGRLADYPEAYNSVLAYGIPDLSGLTSSSLDLGALQEELEAAVKLFEPRLDPANVRVSVIVHEDPAEPSMIALSIEGDLWIEGVPEHQWFKTMIDLETGQCSLTDRDDGPQTR